MITSTVALTEVKPSSRHKSASVACYLCIERLTEEPNVDVELDLKVGEDSGNTLLLSTTNGEVHDRSRGGCGGHEGGDRSGGEGEEAEGAHCEVG